MWNGAVVYEYLHFKAFLDKMLSLTFLVQAKIVYIGPHL